MQVPFRESSDTFTVRRIFCIGRNYAEHAREMGGDPQREAPIFFMKPPAALVIGEEVAIHYPPQTRELHHEVELVAAIGCELENVDAEQALEAVVGYAVGLDMTRRDLQGAARKQGQPWEIGKAFVESAPMTPLWSARTLPYPHRGDISLAVNEQPRQQGDLSDMIWSVADCIAHLSRYDLLLPGDLLFTGTPAGVGPVGPGDVMLAQIAGLGRLQVEVLPPRARSAGVA